MKIQGELTINGRIIAAASVAKEWEFIKQQLRKQATKDIELRLEADRLHWETQTFEHAKKNVIARIVLEEAAAKGAFAIAALEIERYYSKIVEHFGGAEQFARKFNVRSSPQQRSAGTSADMFSVPVQAKSGDRQHFSQLTHELETTLQGAGQANGTNFITPATIKANIARSLRVEKLLATWREQLPPVGEADCKAYYAAHPQYYRVGERLVVTIIESSEQYLGTAAATERRLAAVRGELEGLVTMYDLECQRGNAGETIRHHVLTQAKSLAHFTVREQIMIERGQLEQVLEDYLFQLADDTLSGLVRTQDKVCCFWKWHALPAGRWEWKHVGAKVRQHVLVQRYNDYIRKKLHQLQKAAEIKDNLRLRRLPK